ncbi:hypothetical protein MNBD_GAMMA18-1594 [hydrothermal vent metagenome]|uniref:SxtJ n=1 Tax=hydrothermal vent metagenome TaxID=652676 RepID=A0A3B0Z791_9ZZZZ
MRRQFRYNGYTVSHGVVHIVLFKQQRTFGLVMSSLLAVVGIWLFPGQSNFSILFFLLAGILLLITLGAPRLLSYPARLWGTLGQNLEIMNNYLVLGLLFFLLLTPIALIARRLGYDPLKLSQKAGKSYWHKRSQGWQPESFKDQF